MLSYIPTNPRVIIGMVLFHTYGWTQKCVSSLRQHFPDDTLLIVDNNPHKSDPPRRFKSYNKFDGNYGKGGNQWNRFCDAEIHWLKSQENLIIIPTDQAECHGHAMDRLFRWACNNQYDALVHIEPDCLVSGRQWYLNLVSAVTTGYWVAGGLFKKRLLIAPSIWNVNAARHIKDFSFAGRAIDTDEGSLFIDTAQYVYQAINKKNRMLEVKTPDFLHYGGGTLRRNRDCLYI